MPIPIIDLSTLSSPSQATRSQTDAQLAQHIHARGYAGLTGLPISPTLLAQSFAQARTFFALDFDSKMLAPHPEAPTPHRGYSGPGREKTALMDHGEAGDVQDYKETFEAGSERGEATNIWPPASLVPGFRESQVALYDALHSASVQILDSLLRGLGAEEAESELVRDAHSGRGNQLRLAHYLPFRRGEGEGGQGRTRLAAHSDWSTFTLLFQDEHAGLEFRDPETGEWELAPVDEGVCYFNVGDMLARLSNGYYPAAIHRVTPFAAEDGQTEIPSRYSIPYFFQPDEDEVVRPIKSRTDRDGKVNFEPVTFRDYSTRLFEATQVRQDKGT